MSVKIAVIRTGNANLASVLAGLERAGGDPFLTTDPADFAKASHVVLPGVGSFGATIDNLGSALATAVKERITAGHPTLCVCVGLQLLAAESEEDPGAKGIAVIPNKVGAFPDTVLVPQLGWNTVVGGQGARFVDSGMAFFANSYRLSDPPVGDWIWSTCDHGGKFTASFERGNVLACQFHPELSGEWGKRILSRWVSVSGTENHLPVLGANSYTKTNALTRRVIPCLDVKGGRVVKGIKFQNLKDSGDPQERAHVYEQGGADELVILDVSATLEERDTCRKTVAAVRKVLSIPLTVGGGIRSVEDAGRMLDAGADKVSINTAAVTNPELLTQIKTRFGRQCTVLAIDAQAKEGGDGWNVVIKSGKENTGKDVVEWAKEGVARGAGEILLTSWDRDGTKSGYDCEMLKAVSGGVNVPVIASGGAANPGHLADALNAGADAVLAASIFHYGEYTSDQVKTALVEAGCNMRETLQA